jgi:hypothetical protein
MATSRRVAASSRRALGAAQFNTNYATIPDPSMPAVAPDEVVLRGEVNLQQEGGRSATPLGPTNYEVRGNDYDADYGARVYEVHQLRENPNTPTLDTVVEVVRHLPPGFRTSAAALPLAGLSIGEVVHAISEGLGTATLRGLYLDADVVDMAVYVQPGHTNLNHSITSYTTRRLPLWKVNPILPRSPDFPHGFTGGTIAERKRGFEVTMRLLLGEEWHPDVAGLYDINDPDLQDAAGGSDISNYYILANARLVRRVRAPQYMDTRLSSVRTGGFSELLTETVSISIHLEEVIEAYVEYEGLHTSNFSPEYVEEFKRVVGQLFTVDVFTREDRTITLLVPGGTAEAPYGGCCVDIATFNYLRMEVGEESAHSLMRDVRTRFETLYTEWRVSKKKPQRKRGRGSDTVLPVSELPYAPSAEELSLIGKDLKKVTAHGYSSQIFKWYQTAVHCVTGYLPALFYHRIEKARDYNQGVRVRMVQVGGGGVAKILTEDHAAESICSSELTLQPPFKPINMMRINIEGEIHRHRPKSLCLEEVSEFIPDDDTTGLLHSITFHPGLPDDFFKGVNAKRREVFLSVVQKKTEALMLYYKKASVGLVTMTSEMMEDAVAEQLRRQDSGLTNTLIYSGVHHPTTSEDSSPPPPPTSAAPVFFSNCFDVNGRKIPDRPLVIAYDLETVELTKEAVASGRVGEEYLRANPNTEAYIECERQIPFCVSWVPVNLSDEGRHARLKEGLHRAGASCTGMRTEEVWAGPWRGTDSHVFCSDDRRVREGYVMLDETRVHYGGNILGRCVHEFVTCAVEWAMKRGYTSISAYAHNGVGFDSYVVQAFNTHFEYHSILKTGRGLLSMRMKVPFTTTTNQRKIFPVTFLDTKVFLSFSLAKLCRDFKVPEVWAKLDFPITKITWTNCYHPEVLAILEPYSINDTKALSYIIKQINRIVCLETEVVHIPGCDELPTHTYEAVMEKKREREAADQGESYRGEELLESLHPPTPSNPKPPIVQFCTIMSCVKRVAASYIRKSRLSLPPGLTRPPSACDIPVIRHWVDMASMGGRVSAYAKLYVSSRWGPILRAYTSGDTEGVKSLIQEAILHLDTNVVLDMTSLYPSGMAFCPMPMGSLRHLSAEGCVEAIHSIGCATCERAMSLCPFHRTSPRPFVVVLVRGGLKKASNWDKLNESNPTRHLVGRKMKGRSERGGGTTYPLPGVDVSGIIYTNEEDEEMSHRYWGEAKGEESVLGGTQAFTNIDLYWAWKSGFEYEVVGGYEWETSYELQPLILALFRMRVVAKADGNTCLQQAIKLLLNSLFGIHSQRVIRTVDKVITLPESLKEADVLEEEFGRYIRANHQKIFDPRMKLKENIPLANGQSLVRAAIPGDIGEGVGGYSPNQVGCAVLAWSRHLMSLAMYNIPTGHLTYTDTDSLAVSESWYNEMVKVGEYGVADLKIPPLICPKGNELLTFKNDHSDYFPNARVLFSAIGAKKVKMHIIGCPDTGQLKICSTFKGFLKKDTMDNGDKLHPDHFQHTMAKALLDILYDGKPAPYEGTRWSKSLGADGGVSIDRGVKVEGASYTYLGKHQSFCMAKLTDSPGTVALNVPFGTDHLSLSGATGVLAPTLDHFFPTATPKRDLTHLLPVGVDLPFIPPHQYHYTLPDRWRASVEEKSGVSREDMYGFISQIFSQKETVYHPPPPPPPTLPTTLPSPYPTPSHILPDEGPEEKTWDEILDIFDEVDDPHVIVQDNMDDLFGEWNGELEEELESIFNTPTMDEDFL